MRGRRGPPEPRIRPRTDSVARRRTARVSPARSPVRSAHRFRRGMRRTPLLVLLRQCAHIDQRQWVPVRSMESGDSSTRRTEAAWAGSESASARRSSGSTTRMTDRDGITITLRTGVEVHAWRVGREQGGIVGNDDPRRRLPLERLRNADADGNRPSDLRLDDELTDLVRLRVSANGSESSLSLRLFRVPGSVGHDGAPDDRFTREEDRAPSDLRLPLEADRGLGCAFPALEVSLVLEVRDPTRTGSGPHPCPSLRA